MAKYEMVEFKIPSCELTGNRKPLEADSTIEATKQFYNEMKKEFKSAVLGKTKLFVYPKGKKEGNTGWTALKIIKIT